MREINHRTSGSGFSRSWTNCSTIRCFRKSLIPAVCATWMLANAICIRKSLYTYTFKDKANSSCTEKDLDSCSAKLCGSCKAIHSASCKTKIAAANTSSTATRAKTTTTATTNVCSILCSCCLCLCAGCSSLICSSNLSLQEALWFGVYITGPHLSATFTDS